LSQHTYPYTRPFLLMEGGPLYRIEKRMGLIKANVGLTKKRALFAAMLTWVPLAVLSSVQGNVLGHNVPVPFLRDFSTYGRFLLAIPMLLLAEIILGPRIAEAAEHFVTSGVVGSKDFAQFDSAVEDGLRLRDSVFAEIVIAAMAYAIAIAAFWRTAVHVSTWYVNRTESGDSITWAGWWLIVVCMPLFHFLVLRWVWRLFLWFRFLGRVRALDMQLFPTHPDEAGGIGFVGEAQRFFGILLFAYSAGICGVIADEVVYDKLPLTRFAPAIAAYVVVAVLIIVAPLAIFTGKLIVAKRVGLHKYGTLATAYTGSFDKKWIRGENPDQEALLGTGDIQSLADLGNSYAFIERMNALPINPRSLIHLVVATLLPMTPLLLTVMPLDQVLKLLFKVLM
jgi:hypothetical protein